MSKVDDNKKQKKNSLLQTAFELFTGKGFAKTTISDIVNQAGLAKGTFYLYFKDKYDLQNKLVAYKASQLFDEAHRALISAPVKSFKDELLFTTDYIIGRFQKDHSLLQFIAKNLSWGIFKNAFSSAEDMTSRQFYEHYINALTRYSVNCPEPMLMLFTIIELIGSTCYNCILYSQPVSMDEYLPYLHQTLLQILDVFTEKSSGLQK